MNSFVAAIGGACVVIALLLDSMSYWKQIAKTLRTKKSTQVSSSQYLYKMGKAMFALLGLAIYANWVGVGLELFMFFVYFASLVIVVKYKPKGWKLFGRKKIKHRKKHERHQ